MAKRKLEFFSTDPNKNYAEKRRYRWPHLDEKGRLYYLSLDDKARSKNK